MTFWEIVLVVVVLISAAEFFVWLFKNRSSGELRIPKEWENAEEKTEKNTNVIGRRHPKDPPDENGPI